MNRKVLAPVVPALLAAGAAHAAETYNKDGNKLDPYGKVDGLHYFSDDVNSDGDQIYMRTGFKGETQVSGMITSYGQWEYQVQANGAKDDKSDPWTRLAFAGIEVDDYGSFDYGRNYGVMYNVEGWTDMLSEFGGDSYTKTNNFMAGRANGVATYRNTNFSGLVDGLSVALQYRGADESQNGQEGTNNSGDRNVKNSNGDSFDISFIYGLGMGVNFGAAYASSNRANEQVDHSAAGDDKADAWTTGVKYDASNIYLATMYSETRDMTPYGGSDGYKDTVANKTQSSEVTAQYQFDSGLRLEVSLLMSKGKNLGINGSDGGQDLVKYASVGAIYCFNKNFSTYVDYKINLLDEDKSFYTRNDISTNDTVALGMAYRF